MKGRVDVEAHRDGSGRTVLTRLQSGPPLTARATVDGLTLVASAGGPLGGDEVTVRLQVGPGADLCVGSAAASVVQPSRLGGVSRLDVDLDVAPGGRLEWLPQPTVVATGARLAARTRVRLRGDGELVLREVVVLGRSGETGGVVLTGLDVERDGEPVLRQENLWNDPGSPSSGPAVLAGRRVVGSLLRVGGSGGGPVSRNRHHLNGTRTVGAVLALAAGGTLTTVLGWAVSDVLWALGG